MPASTARGRRPASSGASRPPAPGRRGRACSSFRRRRSCCRPDGAPRWTRRGRSRLDARALRSEARSRCEGARQRDPIHDDGGAEPRSGPGSGPGRPAGDDRRPSRRLRGDGRRPDPLRPLAQHHRAPRLLDRALRPAWRAGDAGGAHPCSPRLDARRRGCDRPRGAGRRRPLDPQRPLSRRHPPPGHHADLAHFPSGGFLRSASGIRRVRGVDRLRRQPGPPRRHRRADSRRDARRLRHPGRGGGRHPADRADDEVLRDLAGRMRNPQQRLADLRAQRASNLTGMRRLGELASRHGIDYLRAATAEILDYAERRTRAALTAMPDGESAAEDQLEGKDGDVTLRLRAKLEGDSLELDFTGTAEQAVGNLNCPLSVTKAASFYAVRVACDPDGPPSAGAWRPVSVVAPEGSLLHADPPAGVVAGNVETSSRVADLVFEALARFAPVGAQGQGTMNNLTLAGEGFTYYETIGGGQGACPDADGPSAVHVAMSNTLNTPVEALESEYPLLVRELSVRRGSGGRGRHRGGEGIVREIEALEPVRYSLIAERRRH